MVIALLDRRRQDALDSDSVTPHDWRNFFAGLIQNARVHRLRVLVAKLKDMCDLHRFGYCHRRSAVWTAFPGFNVAQICVLLYREVAAGGDITQVMVLFVG